MIPEFPDFKKLELTDEKEIKKFNELFLPYSDMVFTNLWSWDIYHKVILSKLHNNLVIVLNDDFSDDSFVTFIGKNNIKETAKQLIEFSSHHYHKPYLKFINEEMVKLIGDTQDFEIKEDENAHNYIYSVSHLANMNTWPRSTCAKNIRRFINKYPHYAIKVFSVNDVSFEHHKEVFKKWSHHKGVVHYFDLNEYKAFERLLGIHNKNIKIMSLYVDEVLVGFTIYEIVSHQYALSHFIKADISFDVAIYDVLSWEEAKLLEKNGVEYDNWEQDLGLAGLRKAKMKYKPSFFLKQFILSLK